MLKLYYKLINKIKAHWKNKDFHVYSVNKVNK